MRAAGFYSLATSKCPPGSSTIPSPRDPFGSDHARAISPRPSTARSIEATIFSAFGSISSTRAGVSWSSKTRPSPSAQTASIWGHLGEPSNLRASQCRSYASQFGRHRSAAGKTRRSSTSGRRPQSETSGRFGRDANKCQRLREVARRPRGARVAGCCSTYGFPPWERAFAGIKKKVLPLPDDFSSSCAPRETRAARRR
jgi:hypothetical protein